MEGGGERQGIDTRAWQIGRKLQQPSLNVHQPSLNIHQPSLSIISLPPLPRWILKLSFLYLNYQGDTSLERANEELVQIAVTMLTPNWAWNPVHTWRWKPRSVGGQALVDVHTASLQPRGRDLLLSNPIHSSKAAMAPIYSGAINKTPFLLHCNFLPHFWFFTWLGLVRMGSIKVLSRLLLLCPVKHCWFETVWPHWHFVK